MMMFALRDKVAGFRRRKLPFVNGGLYGMKPQIVSGLEQEAP